MYGRLSLLEVIDYFDIQHIKINFLPAIGGKDDQFKNAIFLKYIYHDWSRPLFHLKGQESEATQTQTLM